MTRLLIVLLCAIGGAALPTFAQTAPATTPSAPPSYYQIGSMLYPVAGGGMPIPISYGMGGVYPAGPWYFPFVTGYSALSTVTVDMGYEWLSSGNGSSWVSGIGAGQSWSDSYFWAVKLSGGEFDGDAGLNRLARLRLEFGYRRPFRRLREPPRDAGGTEDERLMAAWSDRWRQDSYAQAQHPEVLERGWVGSPMLGVGLQAAQNWAAAESFENGHPLVGAVVFGGWEWTYRLRFSVGITGSFGYTFPLDSEGVRGHTHISLLPRFAVNF